MPISVAVGYKAQVCGHLIAWTAISNPGEGIDVRLFCFLRALLVAASATRWLLVQRSCTVCVCVRACV
jgi:hypothetical protein